MKAPRYKNQPVAFAHAKHDGWQMRVRKDTAGRVSIKSRNTKEYYEKLKFCPTLMLGVLEMPRDTEVWGELWYPGEPASYVSSAIAKEDKNLRFDAFCSPSLHHAQDLGATKLTCENWGFTFLDFWVDETMSLMGSLGRFDNVRELPIGGDIEGYVLKNGNMYDWYKYKPQETIDLIITGYTEGQGAHEGFIGSIICSTSEGYEVANVSGMDVDTREEISCREEYYIGKVVEVQYQCVGTKGRLRHPTFKRFRDDKLAADCPSTQDENLRHYYQALS